MMRQIKRIRSSRLGWLVVASLWLCQIVSFAQQDIYGDVQTNYYPSPTNYYQSQQVGPITAGSGPSGGPFMGTSSLASGPVDRSNYVPTGAPLVEWGPFGFYPHLLYTVTYGNGIQAQPGVNSTTFVNTVAPGIFLKMGALWFVDYTPSLAFYSNPLFHDTTDQKVLLNGAATNGDWVLNLSQSYIDTTQPLVETGTQTEQQAYATALNANWQMSTKTSLQLGLNQNFRFAPGLVNLHEWTMADWYNYQLQPQLGLALGVTGGFDELSAGSSNPFEQALGRLVFRPGGKLSLTVIGGLEDRQFLKPSGLPAGPGSGTAAPSLLTPIFQVIGVYQIRDGTLLTILGDRSVSPSLIENQLNTVTTVSANIRQDVIGKMFLDLSGGYTGQSYTSVVRGPLPKYYVGDPTRADLVVVRSDTRTFAKISLSTVFRTRLTGSIFYMLTENASGQSNFRYTGNQVGLQLNYRY